MQIDGLVLAGGRSRRMGGGHKGELIWHDQTFQEHVIEELKKEADEILLSYASEVHAGYPGCRIIMDETQGIGPIGGLCAGLKNSRQGIIMVAACDMPLLDIDIYRYLYRKLAEEERKQMRMYDGAVPVTDGKMHPLAAIYRATALRVLERQISAENYRMTAAVRKMNILYVDMTEYPAYTRMLRNINTMEEYQELMKG